MSGKQNVKRARPPSHRPLHQAIKERLGYTADEPDAEVLRDWRARLRRVCKPCWELKYCPFGPFVEQSPLLPLLRSDMEEDNARNQMVLKDGYVGSVQPLTEEWRAHLIDWLNDYEILTWQAYNSWRAERRAARFRTDKKAELEFNGPLPPIEQYRVSYNVVPDRFDWNALTKGQKKTLKRRIRDRKAEIRQTLRNGYEDTRRPLTSEYRKRLKRSVRTFDPLQYPEEIPAVFRDGECNIFGHICPVFFTAEAMTETSTERRRGRYISFQTKMRVVRRDNHTCQHCGTHLADSNVEFDHKIPISRGGGSEEHNIRLTCFKCNRDKNDEYVP